MGLPRLQGYEGIAALGSGGSATVYLVRHGADGTLSALKVLHVPTGPVRERLLREGEAQRLLRHPNIVAVHGVVALEGGAPALLMEYVPGPSLATLTATQRLTLPQVDVLARQVIAAVGAAHAEGIVHRDLKPSNILLQVGPDGLVAKVSDFGIAKLLVPDAGERSTLTGAVLGTPPYMSPEQLTDAKSVDARADIFSLGAVLYELVTGVAPFGEGGHLEVLARIQAGECAPPEALCPGLPLRMQRAIAVALERTPAERWSSCEALLDAWVAGTPQPEGGSDLWPETLLAQVATLGERARSEPTPELEALWPNTWLNTQYTETASSPRPRRARVAALLLGGSVLVILLALVTSRMFPSAVAPRDETHEPAFRRLTFNPLGQQILDAALSPDGRRLLTAEATGLFLRDELPGPAAPLLLPRGATPAGSVVWCGEAAVAATLGTGSADPDVWWAPTPQGPWHRVLEAAEVLACAWDGAGMLARTLDGLATVDLPSTTARILPGTESGYVSCAAFSPDAGTVAFMRSVGERSTLERVAASGAERPVVIREDLLPHGLAWAADGRLFLLQERPAEADDRWASILVQQGVEGRSSGEARVFASRVGPVAETLSVSRSGEQLTYLTLTRQRDLHVFDISQAEARPLTDDPAPTFAGGWLDERHIAYSSAAEGGLNLFVRDIEATRPVPLLSDAADAYGVTAVPGTRAWLYARNSPGGGVEILRREGDTEERLWAGGAADYLARNPTRCVPGPQCFLAVVEPDGLALSRILPGGPVSVVHLEAESWRPVGWDVDPTAARVAWASPGGLSILELDTGEVHTSAMSGTLQEVAWTADGQGLWGTGMGFDGHTYAVVRIDPASGEAEVVHHDLGWISHLSRSPDGRHLAWTRTTYDIVAWMAQSAD
ncbi:MAG: serine/threonine protein kinase [Deltaproteobacteria bacterium]|nr:serine/threonine protein kinase [Deltaproteobacteria bacterium]